MGLKVARTLGFCIQMANLEKVKCLGVVKDLEIKAYDVKIMVNFHVMPIGLGAYPIILRRPWLHAVGAVQDWRRGIISLYGKIGGKRSFDMDKRKPIDEDIEEEYESSEKGSSTTIDVDSDSTSSSEEDMEVAFLLLDEDQSGEAMVVAIDKEEYGQLGPYKVIEELMQPRVELAQK